MPPGSSRRNKAVEELTAYAFFAGNLTAGECDRAELLIERDRKAEEQLRRSLGGSRRPLLDDAP